MKILKLETFLPWNDRPIFWPTHPKFLAMVEALEDFACDHTNLWATPDDLKRRKMSQISKLWYISCASKLSCPQQCQPWHCVLCHFPHCQAWTLHHVFTTDLSSEDKIPLYLTTENKSPDFSSYAKNFQKLTGTISADKPDWISLCYY